MALYAFDGTGNEDREGTARDSNVLLFFRGYTDQNDDPDRGAALAVDFANKVEGDMSSNWIALDWMYANARRLGLPIPDDGTITSPPQS